MSRCFFVSDLHGHVDRYEKLFDRIGEERPVAVFLGGDLLPGLGSRDFTKETGHTDFINGYLAEKLEGLRESLVGDYPRMFVIMGNDDPRSRESSFMDVATRGLWEYVHDRSVAFGSYRVYGYAYVNPSPFQFKDWERYDVSRYVDPGCISPEQGSRSVPVSERESRYSTIQRDLTALTGKDELDRAIMLFHAPPYETNLDRAALDGKMIDWVPLDVHVGSVAIRRLIEERQPLITLHGHVHESARLTGSWRDEIGHTICLSAAHDGSELALVRFDPAAPSQAERELL